MFFICISVDVSKTIALNFARHHTTFHRPTLSPFVLPPISCLFSTSLALALAPLSLCPLAVFSRSFALLLPPGVDTFTPQVNTLGAGHPFFPFHDFNPSPRQTGLYQPRYPMAIQTIPEICISPAPPSENLTEPFSPFDNVRFALEDDHDSFRPALLSPPPNMPTSTPRHLSPLSPPDAPVKGQGLERERFEQLLKSSRERSAALGNKRAPDLRKELALKTYKSKQSASSSSHPLCHVDPLFPVHSGTPCALLTQSGGTA